MRIISGQYKGRRIMAPKKLPVRPTTDMAKEALFNILNNRYYLDDIRVLDLFAGTGNISFEFASRGTKTITAVDSNYGCVKFINEIAASFEMPISTVSSDVFKFLERTNESYDIIFADPPYNFSDEAFNEIPKRIFANEWLHEDGLLVIEHSKHTDLSESPNFVEFKTYGGNRFSFFAHQ